MKLICFLLTSAISGLSFGQNISGKVLERKSDSEEPLIGVLLRWQADPQNPVFTDETGAFQIPKLAKQHQLILSMTGYKTDTVMVYENAPLSLYLEADNQTLEEVLVKGGSTVIDRIAPQQTQLITTKELAKAACCNLSESFETNASVSVSFADAITGTKQLQMLGLSGKYIQTNIENIPSVRGLSIPFGLGYIPGTWIQSIDVGKGSSSVINGYESMAGAINVELLKPDNAERIYVNAYVNELGRSELNLNASHKFNKKWSTGLLTHGSFLQSDIDRNGDHFKDLPRSYQVNLLNRWKYSGERFMGQFGVNYLKDNKEGGEVGNQVLYRFPYLFENNTEKISLFSKTAILFPETPYRGLGLIMNYSGLNSTSKFGINPYNGQEKSFYANLIYQDIFGNTNHTYKTGLSFLADYYDENYANFGESILLKRNELVPGAFFEYTYNNLDRSILVLGLRGDRHNLFGTQFTPRMHFKQDIGANDTWRISVGRGFRVPTPLAENYGKLVSSRMVELKEGIQPEISWNIGISLTHMFGKSSLTVDAYHSFFVQQQIVDMDESGKLKFYNSTEPSYATSIQAELSIIPSEQWEFKAAYRWLDVKQTMSRQEGGKVLRTKAFVPKDYALFNVAYAMPYDKWKFDFTVQYKGKQRLPDVNEDVFSRRFITMNTQVSRNFVDWEYYVGIENLTNFKQKNPIIQPNNPFGGEFDAGQTWGPIVGRIMYAGFRYRLR